MATKLKTIIPQTDEQLLKTIIDRLRWCKEDRKKVEDQWAKNEIAYDSPDGFMSYDVTASAETLLDILPPTEEDDEDDIIEIGTNYIFKYTRFIHSQMSANPPSVAVGPTSSDISARNAADAADRLLRWGRKQYDFQEVFDQRNERVLKYGIGWIKILFDPNEGAILEHNPQTNEILMEGEIDIYSPDSRDVWIDCDAKRRSKIRYTFERLTMSLEEAYFRFPKSKAIIDEYINKSNHSSAMDTNHYEDRLEIYEYVEKGMPTNAGLGRRAYLFEHGPFIEKPTDNNHPGAGLPLKSLTYIDAERHLYGRSTIEYAIALQDAMNKLDTSVLDNIRVHNALNVVVAGGIDNEQDMKSNRAVKIIRVAGQGTVHYLAPPQLMPDIWRARQTYFEGMQDLFGINDSMLGIQRREQSAVSQQTSIESGLMLHRRLYLKSAKSVEEVSEDFLGIIKEEWKVPRTIQVLGKEKAFETADIKGADITHGYSVDATYGANLPLDPNMKREFLNLNLPLLKEAGLTAKDFIRHMGLNDVEGALDRATMAQDRQKEVFEEMIAAYNAGGPKYIMPEEGEDHLSRLEWCRYYRETSEFKYLADELKELIKQHIKERMELAAQEASQLLGQMPPPPAPGGVPFGMPGVEGAMAPSSITSVSGPLENSGIV